MPKPKKKKGKAGAPIGNKNGVGHGRPPNEGFSDKEITLLGEELLQWCDNCDKNNIEIVHLSEFYSEIKKISPSQWQSIGRRDCFIRYYERALIWMGKRILKNKNLSPTYGSRFLGIYFKEVRDLEIQISREKIDYEIEQKKNLDQSRTFVPNDVSLSLLINELKLRYESPIEVKDEE